MADTRTFTTRARQDEPIRFTLDGDEYTFTRQKIAPLALAQVEDDDDVRQQARSVLDWLGNGLGQEGSDRLLARLRDPNDDLDFDTLNEVVQWLMEASSGRPTTLSPD